MTVRPTKSEESPRGKPPAELRVTEGLVRVLLERQHPDLAGRSVRAVDEGWDNFTFRLGRTFSVRLPRRALAVPLIEKEQRWLGRVASRLPLEVPVPVRIGRPCDLFPWPWSVVPWISGSSAERAPLSEPDALIVAAALRSLHTVPPSDAPVNSHRGVPLAERDAVVADRLARLDQPALGRLWARALAAPLAEEAVWIHGDLHGRNVIVREGAVAGLIDWGDLAAGDRATDLACAWTLFEEEGRRSFFDAYAPSRADRVRALGWAVSFASTLLDSGDEHHVLMGRTIARRVVESPGL